jgi:hypothetical protein
MLALSVVSMMASLLTRMSMLSMMCMVLMTWMSEESMMALITVRFMVHDILDSREDHGFHDGLADSMFHTLHDGLDDGMSMIDVFDGLEYSYCTSKMALMKVTPFVCMMALMTGMSMSMSPLWLEDSGIHGVHNGLDDCKVHGAHYGLVDCEVHNVHDGHDDFFSPLYVYFLFKN